MAMDIQDTDVSADAPDWFKIKFSRVAARPMSPNERISKLPPRGKAECSSKSYVFSEKPPTAAAGRRGKFGTHELMLADTVAKPMARRKDPTSMNARHQAALARSTDSFRRQKGSLQHYLEQAVHNRHILPVQRAHQRLSPLTESLPRALARSQSANVDDFQKLYGGLDMKTLGRAATASSARRSRAMAKSLRLARSQGRTFANARPDTTLSMSRAELKALRMEEEAAEFARDMLQARAISRLSPRVTKDQAPGYTPHDAFGDMQRRPLTSTATLRGSRRSPGRGRGLLSQSRLTRSATAIGQTRGSTSKSRRSGGRPPTGADGVAPTQSILHVVGLQRPATALSLQHPHLRVDHGYSRMPYSPISASGSVRERTFGAQSVGSQPVASPGSDGAQSRRRDLQKEVAETASLIDNFERKQGLHGPGYMTRKELRMKLRGTEEYNLGVDLKRASKEELVAAYNQYQQMMKDGIIDKAEHKRKKAARLTESLRLQELSANSVHSVDPADNVSAEATAKMQRSLELGRHAAPPPASGKPLQFNVRKDDTGPVQRLTPRSGSKLVTYFDTPSAAAASPQ